MRSEILRHMIIDEEGLLIVNGALPKLIREGEEVCNEQLCFRMTRSLKMK